MAVHALRRQVRWHWECWVLLGTCSGGGSGWTDDYDAVFCTSECINSMINDYHSEGWTDLLEGTLWKMAEKTCENRQRYKTVDGDEVVCKVKQVLKEPFHSAAAMQVVELEVRQKYMVTEAYGAMVNINLNQQQPESMPLPTSENGKTCHSLILYHNMCMTITGTKACNRYMIIPFSQLYKIRSDMMDKPIHQHWGQDNLDDKK